MASYDPTRASPGGPTHIQAEMLARGELVNGISPSGFGASEAQLNARLQRRNERRRWGEESRERLATVEDPTTRLMMAVTAASHDDWISERGVYEFAIDWDMVYELLPSLPERQSGTGPLGHAPWEDRVIVEWFLSHCRRPPDELVTVKTDWFWDRRRRHAGWWFEGGSTAATTGNTPRHVSIGVLADGRLLHGRHQASANFKSPWERSGLNARAVRDMAALAELSQLPELLAGY